MTNCNTSQFKIGLKIIFDSHPHIIVAQEFVNPGKGQAFYRVKLRNIINQKLIDKTYKSGEVCEIADVEERWLDYLYRDEKQYHFMDPATFEQVEVDANLASEISMWLTGNSEKCSITFWNNRPVSISPPAQVELTVIEAESGYKGDTACGGMKNCTLETGAKVKVPLFIEAGARIKVDTKSSSYISKA